MKRLLMLLIVQSCLAMSVYAQTDTAATIDTMIRSDFGYDTIQVIHQIFAEKRKNAQYDKNAGLLLLSVGVGTSLAVYGIAAGVSSLFGTKPDLGRVALFSLALNSPGLVVAGSGLAKRSRFSKAREDAVILAYQQGEPLPPVLVRQLRKRFRKLQR